MERMAMTAGSDELRRVARARSSAAALCCVLALTRAPAGCVAAKTTGNGLPASALRSIGTEDGSAELSIQDPDDWDGRLIMVLRGAVPHQSAGTPYSDGSVMSEPFERGSSVATPPAGGRVTGIPASGEDLQIHFLIGFGSPDSVYLIGLSLGEFVALATVGTSCAPWSSTSGWCGFPTIDAETDESGPGKTSDVKGGFR